MTSTSTSELTITHLDEDWALPCEYLPVTSGGCGGTDPAVWIAYWHPCCDRRIPTLWCAKCLTAILAAGYLGCGFCGTQFVPPRDGLTTIEPLNRRTQ